MDKNGEKGIPICENNVILEEKEISQRAFPIRSEKNRYISYVNSVSDPDLKLLLKVILCSGFRFSEALNAFLVYDSDKNKYLWTTYALKRKEITQFKLGTREAVKIRKLQEDLIAHPERFKTVPLINPFKLDISDLTSKSNDMYASKRFYRPISSYFEKKTYKKLYAALKKEHGTFRVYYLNSKLNAIEKEINIIPSFHFFRKLFASELYYTLGKDTVMTVEYMKWSKMERLLDYVKAYQNDVLTFSSDLGV